MTMDKAFNECKLAMIDYFVANPGVKNEQLMQYFEWEEAWRRNEIIRPLKHGHGINGYDKFLFVSAIDRVNYYYEWSYAIANNIPRCLNTGKLTKEQIRDRMAKSLGKKREGEAKSLRSNLKLHRMMKVPKSIL